MTIVADRGLFVRLLVQSGKFEHAQAEALVDAIDATTKEPATKGDLKELGATTTAAIRDLQAATKAELDEVRAEIALLRQRFDLTDKNTNQRFDAVNQRFDAVNQRFEAVHQRFDSFEKTIAQRLEAQTSQITLRLIGVAVAVGGLVLAVFRLT